MENFIKHLTAGLKKSGINPNISKTLCFLSTSPKTVFLK